MADGRVGCVCANAGLAIDAAAAIAMRTRPAILSMSPAPCEKYPENLQTGCSHLRS